MLIRRTFVLLFLTIGILINNQAQVFGVSVDTFFCEQNPILFSCTTQCTNSGNSISAAKSDGSSGGGGCGGSAEENKLQIWSFLKSKGLTDDAAAGIMGNMQKESGFMPTADNSKTMRFSDSSGRGCRGIVQWCGGRNDSLDSFAAERGTSWDCLGTQLEYMWYEMTETQQGNYDGSGNKLEIPLVDALNGGQFSQKSKYTNSGSYNAAAIFHDYFERANTAKGENLGRGEQAEELYKEFTGQPADTSLLSSSSTGGEHCATSPSNGPVPSEECGAVVEEYMALVNSGKISFESSVHRENAMKDIKNCTEDQIECGTDGGKGGVHPRIVRATVAAAKNSGASTLVQWNFNTGHPCDGLNHPRGMAIDIKCDGNTGTAKGGTVKTATPDCNELFAYFYNHYDELGLTELIWQYPPPEYSCSDPKVLCYVAGHTDHIHVGTRV